MSFTDKTVIVTGGGSGIGEVAAVKYAAEGAKVVAVDRDLSRLKVVREKCIQAGGSEPLLITADVSKDDDLQRIVDETINKHGNIDVLINCVGICKIGYIADGSIMQTYDEIMNINLRSVVQLTTLAAPHLSKTNGNVVNVSSVNAIKVVGKETIAYSLSKAGVEHFTRGAAD